MKETLGQLYAKELEMEAPATRKCIERVPESLYDYKPHEKSMVMRNLVLVTADIANWIAHTIKEGDIDFATYRQVSPKTAAEMTALFDDNLKQALEALNKVSDEELDKPFNLKNQGQVLMTSTKRETIGSSINHLVHHRGQLTVYIRLCNLPVPSIYGPSADEGDF
ncbi:MAG: DinB family protein [Candidatus Saccharibacteria bacterium]